MSKQKKQIYQKRPKKTGPAFQSSPNKLRIIPLGGLEEVGRNMTVFEYGKDIIIIDMGLQFPDEDMPGVDYIIPNIASLKGREKNIQAVIITHGHYDHIGGIPHLIPRLGNPLIVSSALTINIIKKRQEDYKNGTNLNFKIVKDDSRLTLGKFQVEFFHINHNIPESLGVLIKTPVGNLVHTGDWKFDYSPVGEKPVDLSRLAAIGNQKILMLLSDSTNASEPGSQISEKEIGKTLTDIIKKASGRIIIGTFASLLSRVKQIIDIADSLGKKVAIDGFSMKSNVEIVRKMGYLKVKPDTLIDIKQINNYPNDKIIILCTGAQGEDNAVLMRIANRSHRSVQIKPGDTIVFSSSVVPGNERSVQRLKDIFTRQGAEIIHYQMMDVHAGGHAKIDDIKLMLQLMKPKYFMPIQGNHYLLHLNGKIAVQIGLDPKNVIIADNGQIIECQPGRCKLTEKRVPADYIFIDGLGVGDVSHIVLRDRQMMAADGMIVIIATVDVKYGKLIHNPDLISRGFVYMKENKKLIEQTRSKVKQIFSGDLKEIDEDFYKNKIRNEIGQFLYNQTERRPMVLPVIIKV